ncbi:nuclear transport factor 2 family protein [Streptomyces sp. VNUA116]|uniref:ester cyclase n=1 Tax=Streptomyces sp. VNUA116 TaxID=3062449 RepID=UPI0026754C3D|nr:nuclear transport factor 2 family protein [Streptomyces sp. VNUA116]WKU48701.1 nuclear transport factor 2 family protein [Streptomyces sp. VNUA116]
MSTTMSRTEAKTIVDAWASTYNDQDFDRFATLYTDDVPYTCAAFGLAFTGRDAFVAHIKEYAGAVPDRKMTIQRVIADGNAIAIEFDFAGTSSGMHPALPPKGEPVRTTFCTVLTLQDGKIASQADYLGGQ